MRSFCEKKNNDPLKNRRVLAGSLSGPKNLNDYNRVPSTAGPRKHTHYLGPSGLAP